MENSTESPIVVSIVIPCYNRVQLIGETLESVLNQTYGHWECIIVDDGSKDGSQSVIEEFCTKDPRYIFHQRNKDPKGANTCRNIGAAKAKGSMLLFLDSDDLLAPWALEERLSYVQTAKFDMLINQGSEFNNSDIENRRARVSYGIENPLQEFLSYEIPWGTPNVLWQKTFFEKTEGWPEFAESWQDVLVHLMALTKNPVIVWASDVPDVFVRIESGFDKISNTWSLRKIKNRCEILWYLESVFGNREDFKSFRKKYESDIINRIEHLPNDDLEVLAGERFSFLSKFKGYRWISCYFLLYWKSKKNRFWHGVVYRIRFIFISSSRKNPIKNHPVLTASVFNALLQKGSQYPFLKQKINLFNNAE